MLPTRTSISTLTLSMICGFVAIANGAKILCLVQMAPRSHYNVFVPLAEALADRGHNVTVVAPYKSINDPRVTEIVISKSTQVVSTIVGNAFETLISQNRLILATFMGNVLLFCDAFVTDEYTKERMKGTQEYDLVIIDGVLNECGLTVAPLMAKYVIILNPSGMVPWASSSTPVPPSVVPLVILPYTSSMTFYQRLWNSWVILKHRLYYQYFTIPTTEQAVHASFPQALTVQEANRHISLTLTNADPVLFSPRPQNPDLIHVGAMHCRPSRPLPKEYLDFIDKAKGEGAIVFTLGSFVPAKNLPLKIRDAFLAAFARLKQVVFWKFEDAISDVPPNVMIKPWLPQQDLLGHNQTRLLITHGGLLSSQETIYHGVPVVGIPLFYDQIGNVARMRELGIGEALDFRNITEENIYNTIQQILTDDSYSTTMKKYSSILHDQPQKPTDRAVFWVEYVIRHQGAPHLRSAAEELNFIQYFLLDVAAFAITVILTLLVIFVYSIRRFIIYWETPVNKKSLKKISYPKTPSENASSK